MGRAIEGGRIIADTREVPFAAVAAIKGHLAFYPDKVDVTEEPAG